jgi:phenylacetate-CoA ligase
VGNALFVSLSRYPFLWGEAELARMAAEAVEWQPQFLDVDPVYGVVFALYCERRGIRLPSLRFILGSYEFVSVVHRRILERVFGVPVFNLYGSTETGHLLMEAGSGEMRPSLETALLEVLNTDAQGISELTVTTLTNDFMPLIRYRIGDLVERQEQPYYTSYRVHGRAKDAFVTAEGRRVTTWQIDQCVADLRGIAHYQLSQRVGGEWLLRVVPDGAAPKAAEIVELRRRVEQLLGASGRLAIEQTDLLAPESSGKFRLGYPMR